MKIFGMVTTKDSAAYTEHALNSFFAVTPLAEADRFFLIDNDCAYPASLHAHLPRVERIENSEPKGFAENANIAVDIALENKADLYFLNNDIIFTKGWIVPLLKEEPSILSPISNRELAFSGAGFNCRSGMRLDDYLGHEEKFAAMVEEYSLTADGYLQVTAVPFFAVKIPSCILQEVGHFDEVFGRGGAEDYDYCLRAYLAGFAVKYARSSYLLHFGGASSWNGAETREQQDEREFKFRTMFGYKWGMPLLKFLLFEDTSVFDKNGELVEAVNTGKHKILIEQLVGDNPIQIHL